MYIVFDIGGTKMRFAVSKDGETILRQEKVDTPQDFRDAMVSVSEIVSRLTNGNKVGKSAGGIAGTLDLKHEKLLRSPHLPKWVGHPLKREFEKIIGCEVVLENDAAMVGLGEAVHGAGIGYGTVAYITVSTGVGGARIVDGKIDLGVHGFEPGHQIIDADGNLCPDCEKPGDLENYISGSAIMERFGKPPKEITDAEVWNQLSDWLAVGLFNTALHWSPDIFVLGGSMIIGDPAIPVLRTENKLREIMKNFPEIPKLKKAQLKDDGGLVGSLIYLQRQNHSVK